MKMRQRVFPCKELMWLLRVTRRSDTCLDFPRQASRCFCILAPYYNVESVLPALDGHSQINFRSPFDDTIISSDSLSFENRRHETDRRSTDRQCRRLVFILSRPPWSVSSVNPANSLEEIGVSSELHSHRPLLPLPAWPARDLFDEFQLETQGGGDGLQDGKFDIPAGRSTGDRARFRSSTAGWSALGLALVRCK